MGEFVFDLRRFDDKITYNDSVIGFLKILADLDKKLGLQDLVAFLEADKNSRYNTEDFSSTIKFLGALYKTINKDTSLNDGAVLISTIIDIVKESVQIADDIDAGEKSANEIKKSAVKLVSKYTTALDKLTKLTNHKTSFLLIGAAAVALSANFITSLDISTDEEARAQLSSLLKDEVNLAKEVLNTCIKNFFSDDLSSSLFNGKITDNNITAPLGSIALASSAFTGIISGVMTFFDEVEHYKEDGIPENLAVKDALIIAAATAIKETASKYTKGFDDVAFKVIQDFMSFVTQNEVDELFANKSYTELIVENFKTFNYTNTGTADDNELVSYENGKMIYGYDGNDYIGNIASNVSVFGGHDNDTIFSRKGSGTDYSTPQNNSILGGPGNDWLIAYDINSTVYGGNGDDRIAVYGTKNKIFGEDGKDAILFGDGADNNTANGGLGDDIIILESVKNAVIEYAEGDGNDIVLGYDESDIISITGEYSTQTSGADVIIVVGTDSIILNEAAGKNININNKRSVIGESPEGGTTTFTTLPSLWNDGVKIIRGTNDNDYMPNYSLNSAMIYGLAGDDYIISSGQYNTIDGGIGNDRIFNRGDKSNVHGGDGNDSIESYYSSDVTIDGGTGDDYIYNGKSEYDSIVCADVLISGGDGNDNLTNYGESVMIDGGIGDDRIFNRGDKSNVHGGDGNDKLTNYGESNVTIDSGIGNDSISNYGGDSGTIDAGDGDDSIYNSGDSVTIDGGDGDDSISNSGDSVIIDAGDGDDSINNNGRNVTIESGVGNDYIYNGGFSGYQEGNSASINGGVGNDTILNESDDVTIDGGDGDDSIDNRGSSVTIDCGTGNDSIYNNGESVTINGGGGNDTIKNSSAGTNVSINGGDGNDSLTNYGENVTIDGGTGDDKIDSSGENVIILGGDDSDTITNDYGSSSVTIDGGNGNDSISNHGDSVTVDAGDGDDSINNDGRNVAIDLGAGNDFIYNGKNRFANNGSYVTINGGVGNDQISLNSSADAVFVEYSLGDGNDSISGFNGDDTLSISGGSYSSAKSGNDVILTVGDGKISLTGAATLSTLNIIGTYEDDTTHGGDTTPAALSIANTVNNTLIIGSEFADTIKNSGSTVTIDAGTGNDSIANVGGLNISINGGAGNDSIINVYFGSNITIDGGDGNDTVSNTCAFVTINGGAGNDSIYNQSANVKINGGANDDFIITFNGGDTISGNTGDDQISLSSYAKNVFIEYTLGDGNDVIEGFNATSMLSISGADYSSVTSGDDIILTVGDGKISLVGAASLSAEDIHINRTLAGGSDSPPSTALNITNTVSNTLITGSEFNDTISNTGNNVTIDGGAGDDLLTGGNGSDTFIYGAGKDTITDYAAGDKVKLSGYSVTDISDVSIRKRTITFEFDEENSLAINVADNPKTITIADANKTYDFNSDGLYVEKNNATIFGGDTTISSSYKLVTAVNEATITGKEKTSNNIELLAGGEVTGSEKTDTLATFGGDSTLDGGNGKDLYVFGGGNASVSYSAGDKVSLGTGFEIVGVAEDVAGINLALSKKDSLGATDDEENYSLILGGTTSNTKVNLVTTDYVYKKGNLQTDKNGNPKTKATSSTVYFSDGMIRDNPVDSKVKKVTVFGETADFSKLDEKKKNAAYKSLATITAAAADVNVIATEKNNTIILQAGGTAQGGLGNDTFIIAGGDVTISDFGIGAKTISDGTKLATKVTATNYDTADPTTYAPGTDTLKINGKITGKSITDGDEDSDTFSVELNVTYADDSEGTITLENILRDFKKKGAEFIPKTAALDKELAKLKIFDTSTGKSKAVKWNKIPTGDTANYLMSDNNFTGNELSELVSNDTSSDITTDKFEVFGDGLALDTTTTTFTGSTKK